VIVVAVIFPLPALVRVPPISCVRRGLVELPDFVAFGSSALPVRLVIVLVV
jgi:hypothetical protein